MISNITSARAGEAEGLLFDSWFDPIEDGLRAKVRGFIETMMEEEVTTALSRPRYGRRRDREESAVGFVAHRHGRRRRRSKSRPIGAPVVSGAPRVSCPITH